MKFFDRSKILFRVLSVIAVLLAVILVIKSFSLDTFINFDTLFFFGGCVLLLVVIIVLAALRCVIRDAEEDMQALLRLTENK